MAELALFGGNAVRSDPYPVWPQGGVEEKIWLEKVLTSSRWFAGLQGDDPNALGSLFGQRFKELHFSLKTSITHCLMLRCAYLEL